MFKRSVLPALILLAAGLMAAHNVTGTGGAGRQSDEYIQDFAEPLQSGPADAGDTGTPAEAVQSHEDQPLPEPTPRRIELIAACAEGEGETAALWLAGIREKAGGLSDGLLTVDLHGSAALGDNDTLIQRAQAGEIDLIAMPLEALVKTVPELAALQTPLLFNSIPDETVLSVLNGDNEATEALQKAFADKGLRLLGLLPGERFYTAVWGVVNGFSTTAKGLRVAIAKDAVTQSYWRSLGAEPTRCQTEEAQAIVSEGRVDALEGTAQSLTDACATGEGYTLVPTDHSLRFTVLFIGAQTYDMLPESFRTALGEAVAQSLKALHKTLSDRAESAYAALIATGIQSYTGSVPTAGTFEGTAQIIRELLGAEPAAGAETATGTDTAE